MTFDVDRGCTATVSINYTVFLLSRNHETFLFVCRFN